MDLKDTVETNETFRKLAEQIKSFKAQAVQDILSERITADEQLVLRTSLLGFVFVSQVQIIFHLEVDPGQDAYDGPITGFYPAFPRAALSDLRVAGQWNLYTE
ncbi:hypothetical protein E4U30_002391 [Claviceps sp. LM220 group G6]|nr:hypothetical protein E4U30_002391 [Claviceps sp. LM220 group G6]